MEKIKKRNIKTLILICIFVLLLIIIVGTIIMLKQNKNLGTSNDIPIINDGTIINNDTSLIGNSKEYSGTLSPELIFGSWIIVSVEVGGVNDENPYGKISFDNNFNYVSESDGFNETGKYEIKNNTIIFQVPGTDITKQGSYIEARGKLENDKLTLVYPKFPKVVIYERIKP